MFSLHLNFEMAPSSISVYKSPIFLLYKTFTLESEILAKENFELGNDIEKFYELHQNVSLDDLAKKKRVHSKVIYVLQLPSKKP